jgi:hypothetical protein
MTRYALNRHERARRELSIIRRQLPRAVLTLMPGGSQARHAGHRAAFT